MSLYSKQLEEFFQAMIFVSGIIREVVNKREMSFTALSRQQTGIKLVSVYKLQDLVKFYSFFLEFGINSICLEST